MIHPDAATSKGCGCVLVCALAVPAVQAILTGIHLSWLAVLVSPLHALCLLCILMIQWVWRHPAKEALMPLWQERAAALARSGRTGYNATLAALQDLGTEPAVQYLLTSAAPPPAAPYMWSAMAAVAADLCQALHAASGHVAWAVLHALGASVSAGSLLWASWRSGASSSHAVRGICWAGAFYPAVPALERLFAYYLGLPLSLEQAAEAAEAAEAALALGMRAGAEAPARPTCDLLLRGVLACRLVLCAALAARCAEAVIGRLWHAYAQHGLRPRPMDLRRLGLHLSGAVLLLGGAMAPTIGPASPASPMGAAASLGLGLDRLGRSGFAAAGWLIAYPPPGLAAQAAQAEAEAQEEASTLDGIKAKHRAELRRRAAENAARVAVAPLLRECPRRMFGGVQGLGAHDALLHADGDGDEAHEFWEADASGQFRLVSSTLPSAKPTAATPQAAHAAAGGGQAAAAPAGAEPSAASPPAEQDVTGAEARAPAQAPPPKPKPKRRTAKAS